MNNKLLISSLLIVFLLVGFVSAADGYVLLEDQQNSYVSDPVDTYIFNVTFNYSIPDTAFTNNILWDVSAGYDAGVAGFFERENVSVGDYVINSSLSLRIKSDHDVGITYWYAFNGTDYVLLKTTTINTDSADSCGSSGYSVPSYSYDDDYTTLAYRSSSYWLGVVGSCVEKRAIASSIREESIWYYTGDLINVDFSINDELGFNVANAVVKLTRNNDSKEMDVKTTDVTGLVSYELTQNQQYTINVSKNGYNQFLGNITIIQNNYNLILEEITDDVIIGNLGHFSFVTSPSSSPVNDEIVNFTIQATELEETLNNYGLIVYYDNKTVYNNGSSGEINVTANLTGLGGGRVNVTYFINHSIGDFTYDYVYYITDFNITNTTIKNIYGEFDGLGVVGKTLFGTIGVILLVIIFVLSGMNASWSAGLGGAAGGLLMIIIGLWPPIIGGIVVIICLGLLIVSESRGV